MTKYQPGATQLPVSISDLPGFAFSVTPETLTEVVVAELENQPALPGVMVIENGQLLGVVTRLKLFERLGHCFSIDQLLQKPILQLNSLIRTHAQPVPAYYQIDEALKYALSRSGPDVYDPLVVLHENGKMQLVEINLLLQVQSRMLASLSNVVENLDKIDRLINSDCAQVEVLTQLLELFRQAVPYHQAAILALDGNGIGFVAQSGSQLTTQRADGILTSTVYALLVKHRQAICISNANQSPAWQGMEVLGAPLAWLGVPLLANNQPLGLLSIGRNVERTFSSDERETSLAFAQRIIELFKREQLGSCNLNALQSSNTLGFRPARELVPEPTYRESKPPIYPVLGTVWANG